jgi:SAM-dependent methyltransferase
MTRKFTNQLQIYQLQTNNMLEQNIILKTIRFIRAKLIPVIKPKWHYFLAPARHVLPISKKHGFDRGTPIDRYYTDKFLEKYGNDIKGKVLEVGNRYYTKKFGADRVKVSDILDIDSGNKRANIIGDLRDLKEVKDNTYDCLVLTFVFGLIDDYQSALKESRRILKPGGVLLAVTCSSSSYNPQTDYWRFTPNSAGLVFGQVFGDENIELKTYGNTLSGQYTWVGMAAEELSQKELDFHHPRYTTIIGIRAVKAKINTEKQGQYKRGAKNPEIIGKIY